MTCNLKAESLWNAYLCNEDGTCKTPNCPYIYPGFHPTQGMKMVPFPIIELHLYLTIPILFYISHELILFALFFIGNSTSGGAGKKFIWLHYNCYLMICCFISRLAWASPIWSSRYIQFFNHSFRNLFNLNFPWTIFFYIQNNYYIFRLFQWCWKYKNWLSQ